jgi:colanic acid/amylovoran biosynthesis glycosyltransferase
MTADLAIFIPVVGQGSEVFIRRHLDGLVPNRTVVVARRPAPGERRTWDAHVPVLWLDALVEEWGGPSECNAVRNFLREHQVRAALLEYLDIWLPFLPLLREEGIATVAHGHGYDVSMRLRDAHWRDAYGEYAAADAVVVPSAHAAARLAGIGLAAHQLHVVPYGVELPAARSRPLVDDVLRVLMVGRLVPKKNPVASVRACAIAAAESPLHLTVIGEGPLRRAVEAAAWSAPMPTDILGPLPHTAVMEAMQSADIFCQHSVVDPETGDEEGLPVAILEAMAHGLPVVSTKHAGIPEAVVDGVTGYLVDEGDVDGMAECISTLAGDAGLRQRLSTAARECIRAEYSIERELVQLRRLLRLDTDA